MRLYVYVEKYEQLQFLLDCIFIL